MTDIDTADAIAEQPAPKKAPPKKRRKKAKAVARKPRAAVEPTIEPDRPVYAGAGEFAGISASLCPSACTAERCVVSTVGVCKHPFKTSDNGCGPITMANRERALKLIKHQQIELKG